MPISMIFWILYLIVFIFGGGWGYNNQGNRWGLGAGLLVMILIGLLGWRVFGFIIQ